MVFNRAIDRIIANNQKVRENPRGLSQLDGYKRGLANSDNGKSWEGFKGSNDVQPLERFGGADGGRTHDL